MTPSASGVRDEPERPPYGHDKTSSPSTLNDSRQSLNVFNLHDHRCPGREQSSGENLAPVEQPRDGSPSSSMMQTSGKEEIFMTGGQLPLERDLPSSLIDEESWVLSDRLIDRFEQSGDLADLQQAITLLRGLVTSTLVSDDRYRSGQAKLGVALQDRFNYLGDLNDIEEAISIFRVTANLTPLCHPDKSRCLGNLGNSLTDRFERLGELDDLEGAISAYKEALDLTPHGHPDKPDHLNNLGNSFLARFEELGEPNDLEHAISSHNGAINLAPDDHPNKATLVSSLGNSFFTRFQRFGELSDLEQAILKYREAVDITPDGHPHKPGHLNNLGRSLRICFDRLGELNVLEDAISNLRVAVDLTPHGHPGKAGRLDNLGNSLKARFTRLGELHDLEDAISVQSEAVDLTPDGHPETAGRLNNLGNSFFMRFVRLGQPSDLEHAISKQKDAVAIVPRGHPIRPGLLCNLGNSFKVRSEHLGHPIDLGHAISLIRDAIGLIPNSHPEKPALLNNLGNSLFSRFEQSGALIDLEDAILSQRDAVDLTPHGHPDRPSYLSNLGNSIATRFEYTRLLNDLEDAISKHKEAVDLTADDHPNKSSYLNSLGNSYRARFSQFGELSGLDDAISTLKDAVSLTPLGHPNKPAHLSNLGSCLVARFKHLGELSDVEDAMSRLNEAVALTPDGHLHKPGHLNNLGDSFRVRFDRLGELSDLKQAIFQYSRAASAPLGPVSARFQASRKWISCAQRVSHHTLLHAYSIAISLLPELAWIGNSLTQRYYDLARGANVVHEAVAAALDSGLPETAVEWLEQGRSIVWEELFQLRSSYQELSSAHPDHARRLRELSTSLEHASTAHEKSWTRIFEQAQITAYRAAELLKQETDRHRMLAMERDELLREIRGFPGFDRFLLQKDFSQLRSSAHSGPVVLLNAAETRCDALIVLANVDHVIHVPLPDFNFKRTTGLQNMLEKLLGHTRTIQSDEREGASAKRAGINWESLLSTLWNSVVKPILNALAFLTPRDLSRIFWCPTGPFTFLPIHAAGFYDTLHAQPGHKVSDFVISSYAPTLNILSPSLNPSVPGDNLRILAVRQPPSDGLSPLPGVVAELEYIRTVVRDSPSTQTTLLESSDGTVEEVLDLMKEADWVHFACHGIQDGGNPTNSGLCLADGRRMKLHDIIALSRPRGGLAFLSACQTAMGDDRFTDEAIHVAAGMLFAGYGSVVGTMWSISDKLAPEVARDVYKHLFRDVKPDYREAALALHGAIERLRESGKASFVTWLPFIHVGL